VFFIFSSHFSAFNSHLSVVTDEPGCGWSSASALHYCPSK
jgi:hypothetical protein